MIRFTSTTLRPVLTMTGGCQRPLILEKTVGIYLRVPDDNHPGGWLRVYAEGCCPQKDADWDLTTSALLPQAEYTFLTYISQAIWDAVIHDHDDLYMRPTESTVEAYTRMPLPVWVPVADYRDAIGVLNDYGYRHFHACVNDGERAQWRRYALAALDEVIRLDCKRAKPTDRKRFNGAVFGLKTLIGAVSPGGVICSPFIR